MTDFDWTRLGLPVGLLVAFLIFLCLEFLVPTGGTAGIAAVAALVAAIYYGYQIHPWIGLAVGFVAAVLTPIVLGRLIRIWPRTWIGRAVLNLGDDKPPTAVPTATTAAGTILSQLVGRQGVVVTEMLPGGMVRIDDQTLDAITDEALPIDAVIEVTRIDGNVIYVRRAADKPSATSTPPILQDFKL